MSKILLLGAQHGNELLGMHLFNYIKHYRSALMPFVTYHTGNPRALKQKVRFIESDLNRSYNGRSETYEERRGKRILSFINQHKFDIVLDLHTTTCEQPPCFITTNFTPQLTPYLSASSIQYVVNMNHTIATTSLIGVCHQAISIEVNNHEATTNMLLDSLCDDIERYICGATMDKEKLIYHVDDMLLKSEMSDTDAASLQNFILSPHGFYPILVGENSYKKHTQYLGFKASEVERLQI